MKKTGEKIKSFFKTTGKIIKNTWFVASALMFPLAIGRKVNKKTGKKRVGIKFLNTLKKNAIYFGFYAVLQPAAGWLFPKAEDYLKKEDLPENVVTTLAPGMENKIHIRKDNLIGATHAFFDQPVWKRVNPLFLLNDKPFFDLEAFSKNGQVAGYAQSLQFLYGWTGHQQYIPVIYVRENNIKKSARADFENVNAAVGKASDGKIVYDPPLSAEEHYIHTLLHEIRHHGTDNYAVGLDSYQKEADANYAAVKVYEAITNDPTYMSRYFTQMSMTTATLDGLYDHTLYFHAKENGMPVPSTNILAAANTEAQPVVEHLNLQQQAHVFDLCDLDANKKYCEFQEPKSLSPMARMRVDFAKQAFNKRFVPKAQAGKQYQQRTPQKKPQRVRSVTSS